LSAGGECKEQSSETPKPNSKIAHSLFLLRNALNYKHQIRNVACFRSSYVRVKVLPQTQTQTFLFFSFSIPLDCSMRQKSFKVSSFQLQTICCEGQSSLHGLRSSVASWNGTRPIAL